MIEDRNTSALCITKAVVDRLEQLAASPGRMNAKSYLFIRLSLQPIEINYLTEEGKTYERKHVAVEFHSYRLSAWLVVNRLT